MPSWKWGTNFSTIAHTLVVSNFSQFHLVLLLFKTADFLIGCLLKHTLMS